MKKMQFLFLAFFAVIGTVSAQTAVKKTATLKTPTVQCEKCKARIENYMRNEAGIVKIDVDYKRKTTTVTYLTDRTNVENIKAMIANVGYDADDVTAEPDAYKRLPSCCKKPADGGTPAKQ